jgi:hypothetical protein
LIAEHAKEEQTAAVLVKVAPLITPEAVVYMDLDDTQDVSDEQRSLLVLFESARCDTVA